jgi:ADP-heptose:LPS heptosyltransferase
MVTGQARVMQQTDPRKVRVVRSTKPWHEAWENNPRLAHPDEVGDFQILTARTRSNLRPYMVSKTPQQWMWMEYRPERGELYLADEEKEFGSRHAGRIIVEPNIKPGASPNKAWPWLNWGKLVWLMAKEGLRPIQLGPLGTRVIDGADFVMTYSMRHAAAVMAESRAVVTHEGGLHHVAAAVNTSAVVIYGGFISPRVTGYDGQAALFEPSAQHPLGCGMRVHCEHCKKAMSRIAPEDVFNKLKGLL